MDTALQPTDKPSGPGAIGWIFLILVLGVIWSQSVGYFFAAHLQYRSATFPSVDGRMTVHYWVEDDGFNPCGVAARKEEVGLNVEYNYAVNGRRYFGYRKRFAPRRFSSGSAAAIALAQSWGKGKTVKVFYDPTDPAVAALDNLFTEGDWKTLAAAIAMCLVTTLIGVTFVAQTLINYRNMSQKIQPELPANSATESQVAMRYEYDSSD
jgi:hypothetical protein